MGEYISLFKGLHIIGFTTWFAGLFFLGRIFIRHVKAAALPEGGVIKAQYADLESNVYKWVCNPAMMFTFTFGILMLVANPKYFTSGGWLHIKLTLVVLLLVYHLLSKRIMKKLRSSTSVYTLKYLHNWNATLFVFLIAIVFLGIYQANLNFPVWGVSVVVASVIVFIIANKRAAS